jgi:hypothetical protein
LNLFGIWHFLFNIGHSIEGLKENYII